MSKTGAQLLIEALVEAGVERLFTLSGNQILSIYDATIGQDIELIHTRHEAAAVHMADAWGRLTEQPGVALLTAGPGHCNAISALYVAQMAESPVLLLSGHCPIAQIGKGAFQEIDQVAVAEPVTKAAWRVDNVDAIGESVSRALPVSCSGRPGPVHLSLPADVLETMVSSSRPTDKAIRERGEDIPVLSSASANDILDRLAKAKHPLILAGPAMSRPNRWSDIVALSRATGIPAFPMESPRGINDPWLHMAANCLSLADVVLLAGKKLDFSLRFGQPPFFAGDCYFIQIAPDETAFSPRAAVTMWADPSSVIRQLTAMAPQKTWGHGSWRETVETARNSVPTDWQQIRRSSQQPIHPLQVCEALQGFLDAGAVLVSDGGEFGQWVQAGVEAQHRLINGPSGSIGSALPMGLAAKLAHPIQPVFVVLGDGTFGYHAMELDTALRYNLPIITIVGNDARWNAEHQLQIQNYGVDRTVGCDLLPSRYDDLARALSCYGEQVQNPDDLVPALERAIDSNLPACINVVIESVAAPTFWSNKEI